MANKKETRWNLKALGEYARYFLIVKNAVDRVVREYTESLTERLNIDEESNQPDFAQLMTQCKNIKIARDKADELLSWYYSCYLAIVMNEKEPEVIKTPDDIQSEEVKNITVTPLYSCPIPNDISSAVDATKEEKEAIMLNNLKDAVRSKEELEDEGADEAGEETV